MESEFAQAVGAILRKLQEEAQQRPGSANILVQHATGATGWLQKGLPLVWYFCWAGAGKSATMAWLVHCLRSLLDAKVRHTGALSLPGALANFLIVGSSPAQGRGFSLLLILSDRLQLDRQLLGCHFRMGSSPCRLHRSRLV